MIKYQVIHRFRDLQDNDHVYNVGDWYPRRGSANEDRASELSNENNKLGEPLIKIIETKEPPALLNLDDTIENLKEAITIDLGQEVLNELLVTETADKKRKGIIEHIKALLSEGGDE